METLRKAPLFRVPCKTNGRVTPLLLCLTLDHKESWEENRGKEVSMTKATLTAAGALRMGPCPTAGEAPHG